MISDSFPGTPAHRSILRVFAEAYTHDARVVFVGVFGSLGRGDWSPGSDVDVDVVIGDDVRLDPVAEVWQLAPRLQAAGQTLTLVIPDGEDAADAVLHSLLGFSVRYHPVAATSPNIVDTLHWLAGPLSVENVAAAGRANLARRPPPRPLSLLADAFLRQATEAAHAIHRGRLWLAIEHLARMRGTLMSFYARTHGGERPIQHFDVAAPAAVQARLGATLPAFEPASQRAALLALLDLVENHRADFAGDQFELSQGQRTVLAAIRTKMA